MKNFYALLVKMAFENWSEADCKSFISFYRNGKNPEHRMQHNAAKYVLEKKFQISYCKVCGAYNIHTPCCSESSLYNHHINKQNQAKIMKEEEEYYNRLGINEEEDCLGPIGDR